MTTPKEFIEDLCHPFGISVQDVYPRPRREFDSEYFDDRLNQLSRLEWGKQLNPRKNIEFGYVVILASAKHPGEELPMTLAHRIADHFPDTGYVAFVIA